jgi:hypothetical protein
MRYEIAGIFEGRRVRAWWNGEAWALEGDPRMIAELTLLSGERCPVTATGPDIPCSIRKPGQAMLLARSVLTDFSYSGEPISIEGVAEEDLSLPPGSVA